MGRRKHTCLILWLSLLFFLPVMAQSSRLTDLEKQRKAALEQIEETSRMLDKNKVTVSNALVKLNVLNEKIKAREQFLKTLQQELKALDREIAQLRSEYVELSRQLSVKKEQYARSLRLMTRRNRTEDKWMFLLSADDLGQMMRRLRYLNEYADYQKLQANDITNKQTRLNEKRIVLERAYREKKAITDKEIQEKVNLDQDRIQANTLVVRLKSKERSLVAEVNKQKKLADRLNKQIEQVIAEEARKAAELAAKEKNRQAAEAKGGYSMNTQELKLSGDFSKNRGLLPMPVSQPGTIVVHYGAQKYQDLKYVQNDSKGIDIQTRPGASAISVFDGTVSRVFPLPGFNISIIVRHGNYLTVYANLSEINVKAGDKVKIGQALGKIYVDSGQNDQTILHFQLWKDTERMNPEPWLRKP
ncbi:MAG: peptidoglycan DD-metalloendopeptidase family protein [Bacteroidales bacterium]|jgi:septal ring factor EnvC (AmiA/AmiB activator)|nr:peptidoglycan DD-metalloendopeptidase family protein [Bacteroidales bacterium]MDD4771197.1 peptidoglycan DD-metalloendopeptidase family protein [Bacteroidales bacterium]